MNRKHQQSTYHASKCKFDGRKYNSDQQCNNDKCRCQCKKRYLSEKDYVGILLHLVVKMENIQQLLWMIQQLCVKKLQNQTMKK